MASIVAAANPYAPADGREVLAYLPAGASHASVTMRAVAAARLDVALPLAQFYISQARATGDLRFLGYADAVLRPWRDEPSPPAGVRASTVALVRLSLVWSL